MYVRTLEKYWKTSKYIYLSYIRIDMCYEIHDVIKYTQCCKNIAPVNGINGGNTMASSSEQQFCKLGAIIFVV